MRRMYSIPQLEAIANDLLGSGKVPSVKADEIIENMEGYSFVDSQADVSWTPIYASVCKNGNKITFVVFGSITNDGTLTGNADICLFNIPHSVAEKLYPYQMVENNVLCQNKITFNNSLYGGKDIPYAVLKGTDTINLRLGNLNNLDTGTYLFRVEITFLLSENLVD